MENWFMTLKAKARKNKELGVIAIMTAMIQMGVGQNTNKNVSAELEKVRTDFMQMRLDQEQHFVKKDEVHTLIRKIDHVNEDLRGELNRINTRVADIQGFLRKSGKYGSDYSFGIGLGLGRLTRYSTESSPRLLGRKLRL